MNCQEAAEFVSALFDGEQVLGEAAEHIGACASCGARMRDYAVMGAELRRSAGAALPQRISGNLWKSTVQVVVGSWQSRWRQTMRIPRFAFAMMLLVILVLSGSLALVKARSGGNGRFLLLTFKIPPKGQLMHCSFRTDRDRDVCGFVTDIPEALAASVRFVRREGERVRLAIKTKYAPRGTMLEPHFFDDELEKTVEEEYWLEPDETLRINVPGLGGIEISGEFSDHEPALPSNPREPLDPDPDEIRLWMPVLLRENKVLVNMAGAMATDRGNDAAAMLYSPGLGRFIFSRVPVEGAVEGKLQFNQVSFVLDGKPYLLVTGAPVSRSENVWVLRQKNWRPSQDDPRTSDERWMIAGVNVHSLITDEKH